VFVRSVPTADDIHDSKHHVRQ